MYEPKPGDADALGMSLDAAGNHQDTMFVVAGEGEGTDIDAIYRRTYHGLWHSVLKVSIADSPPLCAGAVAASGAMLYTASLDGLVIGWDLITAQVCRTIDFICCLLACSNTLRTLSQVVVRLVGHGDGITALTVYDEPEFDPIGAVNHAPASKAAPPVPPKSRAHQPHFLGPLRHDAVAAAAADARAALHSHHNPTPQLTIPDTNDSVALNLAILAPKYTKPTPANPVSTKRFTRPVLYTASRDGTARSWDLLTRQPMCKPHVLVRFLWPSSRLSDVCR
jgi:hypothetical protein